MNFHIPPDTTLSGRNIINASRPGVYGWIRDEKYLYIGQSAKVLTRIASHNIVNTPANPILPDDKIVIWYFKTQAEATFREMEMIMEFLPPLNFPSAQQRMSEANCLYCGKIFKLVRKWQKFCSKKCQTYNAKEEPEEKDEEFPLRPLEGYRTVPTHRFLKGNYIPPEVRENHRQMSSMNSRKK